MIAGGGGVLLILRERVELGLLIRGALQDQLHPLQGQILRRRSAIEIRAGQGVNITGESDTAALVDRRRDANLRRNRTGQTKEQHNTSDVALFHGAPPPCHRGLDGGTHPSGKAAGGQDWLNLG